jgi:hypothetical protein
MMHYMDGDAVFEEKDLGGLDSERIGSETGKFVASFLSLDHDPNAYQFQIDAKYIIDCEQAYSSEALVLHPGLHHGQREYTFRRNNLSGAFTVPTQTLDQSFTVVALRKVVSKIRGQTDSTIARVKADTTQLMLMEINFSDWTVRFACRLVCETLNQLRAPIAAANLAYVLSHYRMQCCGDKTHSKVTVTDGLFAFTASHDSQCNSQTATFSFLAHVVSSLPSLQFDHLHACKATVIEGIYTIANYLRSFKALREPAYDRVVATVSPAALHYVAHSLLSAAPSASMGASNLAIVNATCHSQVEGVHFTGQTITANPSTFLLGRVDSLEPTIPAKSPNRGTKASWMCDPWFQEPQI